MRSGKPDPKPHPLPAAEPMRGTSVDVGQIRGMVQSLQDQLAAIEEQAKASEFEIQRMMDDYNQAAVLASEVAKKLECARDSIVGNV